MSNTKLNKIKQLLGLEVKFEEMKLENGAVLEAEAFEPGQPVFVVSEDERIPVPQGSYDMEDGSVLVVEEEGIIASIGQPEEAPAPEEEEVEMENDSTPKKVVESIVKESHFSSEDILTTLSENEDVMARLADMVFSKLESKLSSYTIESGEMDTEEIEQKLAKQELEEIKPTKHSPEAKQELKRPKLETKGPSTYRDRVLSKLN